MTIQPTAIAVDPAPEKETVVKCEECDKVFNTLHDLEQHTSNCNSLRGNKRSRSDTSLQFDPDKPCSSCVDMTMTVTRVNKEHSLTRTAYDEVKNTLNDKIKELNEKTTQLNEVTSEFTKYKLNTQRNQENIDLNRLASLQEEYDIVKKMVVEKDNLIKELKAAHTKEIAAMQLDKKASEEALNNVTRENHCLKDKENTLMDIFKTMKKYMEQSSSSENNSEVDVMIKIFLKLVHTSSGILHAQFYL